MPTCHLRRFHKDLINDLEKRGISVEPEQRKKHMLFRMTRGRRRASMTVSSSPSDCNATHKALRRAEKLLGE